MSVLRPLPLLLLSILTLCFLPSMETKPSPGVDTGKEPDCFICQLLVVSVEVSILANNETMEHIVENAAHMCDSLGDQDSNIVEQCHRLIEMYLEKIIDMIVVQFFQPYDVCTTLNQCP